MGKCCNKSIGWQVQQKQVRLTSTERVSLDTIFSITTTETSVNLHICSQCQRDQGRQWPGLKSKAITAI